jgi:hypothetical protein
MKYSNHRLRCRDNFTHYWIQVAHERVEFELERWEDNVL